MAAWFAFVRSKTYHIVAQVIWVGRSCLILMLCALTNTGQWCGGHTFANMQDVQGRMGLDGVLSTLTACCDHMNCTPHGSDMIKH